ncbi:MAG: hypothetical protein H5T50_08685 [Nitrososphaeria archaeon]|nr:hypothetical protein [Nitrososphaeria archaeon]
MDKEFIGKFNKNLWLANNYYERQILDSIFNDFKNVRLTHLKLPKNISKIFGRVFDAFLEIESYKTHSRTVYFDGSGCETSDLSLIVDYKIYSPIRCYSTSKTITFIQLKLGHYNKPWYLSGKQLYFMKYWPSFRYKNTVYNLDVFRMYPDICSFYLFAYKNKDFSDSVYYRGIWRKNFRVNAFALSTVKLEYIYGSNFTPTSNTVFVDSELRKCNQKGIAFFLWHILLQNLGMYSIDAEKFLQAMFPELLGNDPAIDKNKSISSDELPSVGIRITVGIKME